MADISKLEEQANLLMQNVGSGLKIVYVKQEEELKRLQNKNRTTAK